MEIACSLHLLVMQFTKPPTVRWSATYYATQSEKAVFSDMLGRR